MIFKDTIQIFYSYLLFDPHQINYKLNIRIWSKKQTTWGPSTLWIQSAPTNIDFTTYTITHIHTHMLEGCLLKEKVWSLPWSLVEHDQYQVTSPPITLEYIKHIYFLLFSLFMDIDLEVEVHNVKQLRGCLPWNQVDMSTIIL